ncbi:hypothetical protein O3M35_004069 [Rhynocoris fuscipes]|uniref:Platelet-derived growth factor (PDGF) family profile domain-containing protein n=1 Tax=Rhynocoris fuscipes TaxID=488301 RepID=A0AAW1CPL9_9HEMI
MPEKQVVKLGPPPDLNSFYWPSCIRIERCGGCCTQNELLSCQPVEKVIINYQVGIREVELGIHHSRDHYSQKKVIVPVEKHIRCKCDCRIKKEDCPRLQEYKKESCACVCTNRDEKAKCEDDASNKTWDPHSCTCNCLEEKECQSGYIFNKHSCSCEAQRTRIRYQPGRNPFLEPTLDQRQIIT